MHPTLPCARDFRSYEQNILDSSLAVVLVCASSSSQMQVTREASFWHFWISDKNTFWCHWNSTQNIFMNDNLHTRNHIKYICFQISYINTYVWNLDDGTADPIAGQQWRGTRKVQTCGHGGERRGWDELREQHGNIYITICKTDSQRELLYDVGNSNLGSVTT